MYFAILGKNRRLSLEEIRQCIGNENFIEEKDNIVFFKENINKNFLNKLAGVVKWGIVLNNLDEIIEYFLSFGKRILGTNDLFLAKILKNKGLVKRYKEVDFLHTDLEVKNKGVEILSKEKKYLVVLGYQNIKIYETIDYKKPVRSMKIGMMPSKLSHLMINLITSCNYSGQLWDPFCGLGTILFMADWLGFDKIWGSDLNTSPSKQNLKWWKKEIKTDSKIEIFKYDVLKPFNKSFLKGVNRIVTEGYLGPIVINYLDRNKAELYEKQVANIYLNFFEKIFLQLLNLKGIIFCLPVYILKGGDKYIFENTIEKFKNIGSKFGFKFCTLPEIYIRKGQKVGRQLLKFYRDN